MDASASVFAVSQVLALVVLSPVLIGLMRTVRARLEGRVGGGVLQPWRDLRKLLRKEPLQAEGRSWWAWAGPVLLPAGSVRDGAGAGSYWRLQSIASM